MLEYFKNKRILVVVAHPDDELLGQGATIHKLSNEYGCTCRAVILGEGLTSRSDERDPQKWKQELEEHRACIHKAVDIIGYDSVGIYDFPDNRFDSFDLLDIIKVVEKEKEEFQPEIIFTHHGGDLNIDHQRTFESVMTATRPLKDESVKTIVTFETPSSTEWQASTDPRQFKPNLFIGVTEQNMLAKCNGMEAYKFEKRPWPHPRSTHALKILAQNYGVSVGKKYSEAFRLIRQVE
ncbi:N-acetylglucosaminyl deacetylase, LmbE family [Fodinibius roseus]|uniref:N-acetylglucosaminyl deacetylase, LmbE family n=1 Tax=Fodinibius roseus TaxID=1194090 RepID=A0A1M5J2B0_9BACT|nr:PIG-L family deacetylase [Fodinibius roseus]SHG34429.1 N-acetylglucosaminyl deacetylase, LmbE family [Fodinibius roseus]